MNIEGEIKGFHLHVALLPCGIVTLDKLLSISELFLICKMGCMNGVTRKFLIKMESKYLV